jgi:hypothetical protein
LKITLIWNIKPCRRVKICRNFGGTYSLHFHCRKLSQANSDLAYVNFKYLRDVRLKQLLFVCYLVVCAMQWCCPAQHQVSCEISPFYFSAMRYINILSVNFFYLSAPSTTHIHCMFYYLISVIPLFFKTRNFLQTRYFYPPATA